MPASTDEDEIEPYYTAKVKQGEQVVSSDDAAAATMPPVPCTLESIAPSLLTGVLGYIYGTGRKSISMLFNKKGPRGIRFAHREGMSSAKSFALLSFSYSVPLCILKRLRDKEDWKNHSAAGAISGLVIAWGNSPMNMLGSSILLAAVSGYLSRAEPGTEGLAGPMQAGAAHAAELHPSSHMSFYSPTIVSSQKRSKRHRRTEGPLGLPGASLTASVSPHSCGLLEQTAFYANCSSYGFDMHPHVALAASTVWEAVRPGCRSCTPRAHRHTDFL